MPCRPRRPIRTVPLAVAGALAAALAGCGGSDTVPYPSVGCCVANAFYQCNSPAAAGRCLDTQSPDPTFCDLQKKVPCPAQQ